MPKIPYEDALNNIAAAYSEVDESMGAFVHMMDRNRWIENRSNEATGAYCTSFRKSKTPRVYMTYSGGSSNVITLATSLVMPTIRGSCVTFMMPNAATVCH